MGAFNTLTVKAACPVCGKYTVFKVQFKYGDTWQYKYSVCQHLKWGGNDIGSPSYAKVIVEGISENPCSNCGEEYIEFDILVEKNHIVSATPITTERQNSDLGYRVIE